jgi:hypothetical protein
MRERNSSNSNLSCSYISERGEEEEEEKNAYVLKRETPRL